MANPQKENGYTAIANEILEHLSFEGISGSEYRILIFVLRKTYGFQKKQDLISLSQFEKGTHMKRSHVIRTIKSLVHKRVLNKEESLYKFNKNWESWVVHKRVPPVHNRATGSTQSWSKSSTQLGTYKRKKETNTKEIAATLQGTQWNELIDLFKEVNPMYLSFYKNTTERKALEDMVARIGFDKLKSSITALPRVINLPYAPKITKPSELQRDFGKLIAFYKQEKAKLTSKDINIII